MGKRERKRVLALMLAFAALLGGCDEGGGGALGSEGGEHAESGVPAQPSTDESALLAQWENCLGVQEQISELENWALTYTGYFARSNDWQDLLVARAVCDTALAAVSEIVVPDSVIREEQYAALIAQGVEADVVKLESDQLNTTLENSRAILETLQSQLYDDIYFKSGFENLKQLVELDLEYRRLNAAYMSDTTNYLLLQLEDRSLWDRMAKQFPKIAAEGGRWSENPAGLEQSAGKLLDGVGEINARLKEQIGASEFLLYLMEEYHKTGSLENLTPEMNRPRGGAALFPLPDWAYDTFCYSYAFQDGEEVTALQPGEQVRRDLSFYTITHKGVKRSEVEDYGKELEFLGLKPEYVWNEEKGELYLRVAQGRSEVVVIWAPENTTVYTGAPMADLIPYLYYAAMTAK